MRATHGWNPERNKGQYTEGPTLCRVERTYVDNELIRVTLEPIGPEEVMELDKASEFVTVMSMVPLHPRTVWPNREQL